MTTSAAFEGYTISKQETTVKGTAYTRHVVCFGADPSGKRIRQSFTSEAKARAAICDFKTRQATNAATQVILQKRIGEKSKRLTTDDLLDAAQGLDILMGRSTITEAAAFYVKHTTPPGGGRRTVKELVDEYAQSREKANRSPFTVRDIEQTLAPFVRAHGEMLATEIQTAEIERWLDAQKGGTARRIKRRNYIVSIFNYAEKRRYRVGNPGSAIEMPTAVKSRPHVLSVADVYALLEHTEAHEPRMIAYMALCLFAGVRPVGEMQRLDWRDIDFTNREIFISDATSKTGDERIIKMTDALVAWLSPHRQPEGHAFYSRPAFERIRKSAGVRWVKDCMRHSFGSYHLAQWQNAGDTAEQMGHTGLRLLFNHYRRAVRKGDAERFWGIRPASAAGGVIQFEATA